MAPDLSRTKSAPCEVLKIIEDIVIRTNNIGLRGHHFDSMVNPALTSESKICLLHG
ncbi:hypothetical protein KIN20_001752 [Parelaphostrongylus tenuis]|uniref:Uncharacterized protein n=1 Tax=Parelaphostrongylus tenuis TaxID=148309 RepID=A0AAD5QCW0_PARTN|nr:hypothetical protein KIN20_001752 [Parelaphostrongylus tenuis]